MAQPRIAADEWEWFGNAGHFICGAWCRFHLCTKVGKYLVSTVGEHIHPRNSGGSEQSESAYLVEHPLGETIGLDRLFETMVFLAGKRCFSKDCDCGLPEISGSELDFIASNTRKEAREGHMKLCRKWAAKQ